MRVVNKYTHRERGVINIMRGSMLGNPFKLGRDGSREEVIEKFISYAWNTPRVLDYIRLLPEDAILECCCAPKPCHGHAVIEIWKELRNDIAPRVSGLDRRRTSISSTHESATASGVAEGETSEKRHR